MNVEVSCYSGKLPELFKYYGFFGPRVQEGDTEKKKKKKKSRHCDFISFGNG
jgi:hypothetical protein